MIFVTSRVPNGRFDTPRLHAKNPRFLAALAHAALRRTDARLPHGPLAKYGTEFKEDLRTDALDASAKIARVMNNVSATMYESNMAEMNYRVNGEQVEPKDVARDFLKSKAVVR